MDEQAPCAELTAAIAKAATAQCRPKDSDSMTTVQASNAYCLTDTAGAVREVTKQIGKTRVQWKERNKIAIITKPGDRALVGLTRDLALWLIGHPHGFVVYVDEKIRRVKSFKYQKIVKKHPEAEGKLLFWTPQLCASHPQAFHFVITLGGDGTVLFSSWLFQNYIPPVIPFKLGSLGFLTPFDFGRYKEHLTCMINDGARVNIRGRLTCTVYRRQLHANCTAEEANSVKLRNVRRDPVTGKITPGGWCLSNRKKMKKKFGEVDGEDYEDAHYDPSTGCVELRRGDMSKCAQQEQRQVPFFTTVPVDSFQVINEIVVDRGPSPTVSLLELFGNDKHLTTVQADGLAISTPTGSTAYSLSAGGSLTHPEIHAILITPICPHTLSFRPTLVPDSMELRVCVPFNSRATAWASFDGRGRVELKQGDHIKITASNHPFPTVCKEDQATDWFNSLQNSLHWNKRKRQKSFAVVESNPRSSTRNSHRSPTTLGSISSRSSSASLKGIGNATSPPPTPTRKSHPTPPTTSSGSSETGQDEIFGMFLDDEWYSRDDDGSSTSSMDEDVERQDDFVTDSEDEDEEGLVDEFVGWTDEEIMNKGSSLSDTLHGPLKH